HIPTNRVYISRDVVFDETMFPFAESSLSASPSLSPTSSPLADQFNDYAHAPLLLPNHGAGTGRGARLELLSDAAGPPLSGHVPQPSTPPTPPSAALTPPSAAPIPRSASPSP